MFRRMRPVHFALVLILSLVSPGADATERLEAGESATFEEMEASWQRHQELEESSLFRGLPWRNVGPVLQGGRLVDIEVVPGQPYSFYVAYASGGIWKTTNNGVSFEPLFDDQPTMIIGDLALDPQDPDVIWVGSGENNSSRSSYGGYGVFRSSDGGLTWEHRGLGDSDRIGRILVDPRDSERVYVAVLGKLYTEGGGRGIYRTTDGGASWQQVLEGSPRKGFTDLVMDPSNPDVLYAAAWERFRRPWTFEEGGEGSGIWKSEDGGESWQRLEGGFPAGEHVGRIGLAIHRDDPRILYASVDNQEELPEDQWDLGSGAVTAKRLRSMDKETFLRQDRDEIESFIRASDFHPEFDTDELIRRIENDEITTQDLIDSLADGNASLFDTDIKGIEVWRSDDAGMTWSRTHEEPIRQVVYTYGYYFGQIRVSPTDADRIYVLGVPMITSGDGGKTWESRIARNMHGDHQALWIDPEFPDRILGGNDGGLNMSFDGGETWIRLNAQEVGQFYAIAVDDAEPYNVYGGLQDNGVLKGSSRWQKGISSPWKRVGGGDGMYIQIDPRDGTTYWGFQFGWYFRNDPSGKRNKVKPRNRLDEKALRYNWQTPIQLSSHNADILYFGANRLFRSMDRGETWTAISEDLTTSPERGDVPFATLSTLSESPLRFGRIWVGTDDGHVWLTRDGGESWKDFSNDFPNDRWVSRVEASHHDEDIVHVSLNGYRDDDIQAYLYRSEDLGETWTDISQGLPAEAVNVIREDPVNADVIYVGTDRGVYVSLDRGESWQALQGGLPNVPVHDLLVHGRDRELVAGTHGRSIFIVDVLPIQELTEEIRETALHIFPKEKLKAQRHWKSRRSPWWFREAQADRVEIPFWAKTGGDIELTLSDSDDRVLLRESLEAEPGVNVWEWDYLLDEELAIAAEKSRLEASEKKDVKKKKKKKKGKKGIEEEPKDRSTLADRPWQEAIRLERPLYVTPGTYHLKISSGEDSALLDLEIEAPKKQTPRAKKEKKIRAQIDD